MRADALKECLKDFNRFRLVFIPSPIPVPSLSLLLRPAPVPKQGTKHLVTDVLVLPYQLLLRPATIDATLQLAQLKGTHPRLPHCLQE